MVPTPLKVTVLASEDIELLAEISRGVTADVAAQRLRVTPKVLRRRLRRICDELDVNTPIEAVVWAARKDLL
nr:LuxR family transcriptional regulator [Actinoallomurus iriomotensis]